MFGGHLEIDGSIVPSRRRRLRNALLKTYLKAIAVADYHAAPDHTGKCNLSFHVGETITLHMDTDRHGGIAVFDERNATIKATIKGQTGAVPAPGSGLYATEGGKAAARQVCKGGGRRDHGQGRLRRHAAQWPDRRRLGARLASNKTRPGRGEAQGWLSARVVLGGPSG